MGVPPQLKKQRMPWNIGSSVTNAAFFTLCVAGLSALLSFLLAPHFLLPAEDAIILFQFSRNLAQTSAITFIPHGIHAEGATDFGWMVMIAAAMKMGVSPTWFVALANIASALGLSALLLKLAGMRIRPFPLLFIVGAFSLMPQYFAALVDFSSLPFALLLAMLAAAYLRSRNLALPLLGLALCLFRPDGVVFAVPLLCSALILYPGRIRRIGYYLIGFVLPGIAYFLWRWHYFGAFLPLPFLVKSDAQRIYHFFVFDSLKAGAHYLIFSLPLLAYALRNRYKVEGNRPVVVCLILLPSCFYFAMRLDQNIGDRFFIFIPVASAVLLAVNWSAVKQLKWFWVMAFALWLIAIVRPYMYQYGICERYRMDNRAAIAKDLSHLPRGTMLVTEAGILPYYSQWIAYDAWGLNTAEFARKLLQPSDVSRIHPDLILVYTGGDSACFPQQNWHIPYQVRTWDNLTRNLVAGANAAGYDPWLVPFGSSDYRRREQVLPHNGDQECWFLDKSSPLYPLMKAVLMRHYGIPAETYTQLHQLNGAK